MGAKDSDQTPIPSQEFVVDIEVSNIRTQDYLRANIQATIYSTISSIVARRKVRTFSRTVSPLIEK